MMNMYKNYYKAYTGFDRWDTETQSIAIYLLGRL